MVGNKCQTGPDALDLNIVIWWKHNPQVIFQAHVKKVFLSVGDGHDCPVTVKMQVKWS